MCLCIPAHCACLDPLPVCLCVRCGGDGVVYVCKCVVVGGGERVGALHGYSVRKYKAL